MSWVDLEGNKIIIKRSGMKLPENADLSRCGPGVDVGKDAPDGDVVMMDGSKRKLLSF